MRNNQGLHDAGTRYTPVETERRARVDVSKE